MPDTGAPQSRLQGARKQLGLALEDVDSETAELEIMVAAADVERALETVAEKGDS